jgi:hypothetical protein
VASDCTDVSKDHSVVDRRRLQRTAIRHSAKVLAEGETVHSCVVHNITGYGVCIEFDLEAERLPRDIAFSFDNFRTIHACKIIWREGSLAGIEFANPPEPRSYDVSRDAKFKLTKPLQRA